MSISQVCRRWLKQQSGQEWQGLLLFSIGLVLLLIILAWGATLQRLDTEKELVSKNAQVQQENLAAIIAETLTQVLDRGRVMSIAANEWFDGNQAESQQRLSAMRVADRAFLRIALYNHDLQQVYASSPAVESAALQGALREMLQQSPEAKQAKLFFAPPSDRYEQAWQVPLVFPVQGNDGSVRGLLLVVLDLGYFLGLYRDIDFGTSGAIQILKGDGEPVAEANPAGLNMHPQGSRKLTIPAVDEGFSAKNPLYLAAGKNYLARFRYVENYPFVVAVSREVDEVLAEHLAVRQRFMIVLGLLSVIIAVVIFLTTNSIRRQARLFSVLEAADQEKRELIIQLEEEKLRALRVAGHDHLTGLPNRRMFNELAVSHLAGAGRSRKVFALLFLDLDRFKQVNDNLGHHVGDLLLQAVAQRLSASLRESDLVARLGGDEFAVLLTRLDNVDDAAHIAQKLVDELCRLFPNLDGHDVQVGTSIGIAIFPRDGHDFASLCQNADAAMYLAKRAGRGRYAFHDQALNHSADRLNSLEHDFPTAIARQELFLEFQPKVRLADFRIVGFEALVRWQHPQFGLIHPGDFINRAERTGWVVDLGDWVFDACCQELASWQQEGMTLVPIACNVAAKQLKDPELPGRFAETLTRHGIDGRYLEVEMTETSLLDAPEISAEVLNLLEQQGLHIALDNFGNGFSSLAYIRNLPIHSLKIDRSFVADIHNSPDDARIISSIISLAHNLRLQLVAVGVESLEQLIHLKTAGCDQAQGYLLSRPVSGQMARKLLKKSFLLPNE